MIPLVCSFDQLTMTYSLILKLFLDGLFLLSNSLEPTRTIQSVNDSKYALP